MYKTVFFSGVIGAIVLALGGCVSNNRNKEQRSVKKEKQLQVGDKAPQFSLPDDTGTVRSLADMRGKRVAIYFYPKDDTPYCTKQACSIRDGWADLRDAGITVWGISYDTPASHRKFKEKFNLNFPLLSDTKKVVAQQYGVAGLLVPDRLTFLIHEDGHIIKILEKFDVREHAQDIIDAYDSVS